MSVCIMLKRNGKLFIGSDRMFICGDEYSRARGKQLRVGNTVFCSVGVSVKYRQLLDYLSSDKLPVFKTEDDVYKFFMSFKTFVKNDLSRTQFEDNSSDSEDFGVFMVANPFGAWFVYRNCDVEEIDDYNAIGSGRSHALGALYILTKNTDNLPINIVREACLSANKFLNNCGNEIDIDEITLNVGS